MSRQQFSIGIGLWVQQAGLFPAVPATTPDALGCPYTQASVLFPRYHQLTTVREVTGHARQCGAGHSYLNQHSAGSGKTLEIATLANSLVTAPPAPSDLP